MDIAASTLARQIQCMSTKTLRKNGIERVSQNCSDAKTKTRRFQENFLMFKVQQMWEQGLIKDQLHKEGTTVACQRERRMEDEGQTTMFQLLLNDESIN